MAKRILVALAMFPLVASANELSVGTIEVSGNTNLELSSGSIEVKDGGSTDTTSYGMSAAGLYYVTPNFGVGLSLDYSKEKMEAGGYEESLSTLIIGPAVGLDFSVAPQVAVFGRGMLGYASANQTETGSPDYAPTGIGLGLEAGVKYFPVQNFSLNASLGYSWVRVEDDFLGYTFQTTTSGFGVNLGLSVYFGAK